MGASVRDIITLNMSVKIFLFIYFIVSAPNNYALASPWGQGNNDGVVISRTDYFAAELPSNGGTFRRLEGNIYAEYGLTENITLGGKALYGTTWLDGPSGVETASGLTEVELFAQRAIYRPENQVVSARIAIARPSSFSSGARTAIASDGVDLDIGVLHGMTIVQQPIKLFAANELAFRRRFGDAADQIRHQSTIGVEPHNRLLVLLDLFSTISVRNELNAGPDFDVLRIQPSLAYRLNRKFRLQIGVNQEIAARNLDRGRTIFLGLWSAL